MRALTAVLGLAREGVPLTSIQRQLGRANLGTTSIYLHGIDPAYRWSFGLDDARGLLLATHVGGKPLAHRHRTPCRLVAPGRRGFQWVKWVERVEAHEDPDPVGAAASTLWSSFSAAGRGAA